MPKVKLAIQSIVYQATGRRKRAVARSGNKDRIERAPIAFHERLRQGYLEMAAREPERFAVLDASQPVERVTQDLFRVLEERLPELFEA